MTSFVDKVECNVIITLRDGREIDISLATVGELANITNYVTSIDISESTNASNKNPVGVVSSNTLKLVLKSNDRSLFPDNASSTYYGFMDNTARIVVKLNDVDGESMFNTFFVSNWTSKVTSGDPYQVIIECTDLLAIIGKNSVINENINKAASTLEAFVFLLNDLNSKLDTKYEVNYDLGELSFEAFPEIEYDNLEVKTMSDWFNTLSQCTLTNIYMGRDNKIKTDYCLDDTAKSSVVGLSDKVNITSASIDKGSLVGYTAVKVDYVTNTLNTTSKISTLTNQTIVPDANTFDINFSDKVHKINAIRLKTAGVYYIQISSIVYSKNEARLYVWSAEDNNVNTDIEIYAQTLKENVVSVTKGKDTTNEMLEVKNVLLTPDYYHKFAQGLLDLIDLKANVLTVSGFFNPRIKLGDIVYVDAESSINVKGYYKVMELKWKITNTIKCTAKLTQFKETSVI